MKRYGFTLIELLIVVAIIAILAAIAVPNFLEAQTRAKVSRAEADQRTLATALEAYASDNNNKYPPSGIPQEVSLGKPPECTIYTPVPVPGVRGLAQTPYEVRIQRLAWLTTPIAYITSVLNDPFSVGVPLGGGCASAVQLNAQHTVMTYWDPPMTDSTKVSSFGTVRYADDPTELNKRTEWMLISFGPDQNFGPAANWTGLWPHYDPTNGTVSQGDIRRSGG